MMAAQGRVALWMTGRRSALFFRRLTAAVSCSCAAAHLRLLRLRRISMRRLPLHSLVVRICGTAVHRFLRRHLDRQGVRTGCFMATRPDRFQRTIRVIAAV